MTILLGDNLEVMRGIADDSVDLVFTSPPYEAARTYGIDFNLRGQDWVDWCVVRFMECLRICKGLVAWNVEGQTRQFRWSATPALLMADLHRAGVTLRKPPIFHRVGIPGSGGPDWLRNDYEFIVCATSGGKLPWSDNTAMGHPPKWAPGGEMSNRQSDGARVNQWGHSIDSGATVVDDGGVVRSKGKRPSHRDAHGFTPHKEPSQTQRANGVKRGKAEKLAAGGKLHTKHDAEAEMREQAYLPPVMANPGNVVACLVGGGLMGSELAHENEAPFPNTLVEFFVRSFCPEGGTVLDPHCGSGTTLAVAEKWGRKFIGIDVRESQVKLSKRRVAEVHKPLFAGNDT